MDYGFDYPYQVQKHEKWQTELRFDLNEVQIKDLTSRLSRVRSGEDREFCLRLDDFQPGAISTPFAGSWVLFWKIRSSGCRSMLAHPEAKTWVATIALDEATIDRVMAKLRLRESFALDEIAQLSQMGNFHLHFQLES